MEFDMLNYAFVLFVAKNQHAHIVIPLKLQC